MLTQREIDKRSGHSKTFWSNVDKRGDGAWLWTGHTNNNHNTVDCESYDYGEFELVSAETSNLARPIRIHKSKMAHHIAIFLTFGVEVPSGCEVFPLNKNHLDVNPVNLWVRVKKSRAEMAAAEFCAANDNGDAMARAVA